MGPSPDDMPVPFDEEREMHQFLTQETRYAIIQYILAHPKHLISVAELSYVVPKSEGSIRNNLNELISEGIVAEYEHPPNQGKRELPSKFFGLTERGVEVLYNYNFLRGVPVLRSMYESLEKSDQIKRHETAPRPELPERVLKATSLQKSAHWLKSTKDDDEKLDIYQPTIDLGAEDKRRAAKTGDEIARQSDIGKIYR